MAQFRWNDAFRRVSRKRNADEWNGIGENSTRGPTRGSVLYGDDPNRPVKADTVLNYASSVPPVRRWPVWILRAIVMIDVLLLILFVVIAIQWVNDLTTPNPPPLGTLGDAMAAGYVGMAAVFTSLLGIAVFLVIRAVRVREPRPRLASFTGFVLLFGALGVPIIVFALASWDHASNLQHVRSRQSFERRIADEHYSRSTRDPQYVNP
jgi:hypothetical protein